ncbi:unnamed protein product [Gongylonema pulchrum]|uniref:Protein KAKU4 n=1 Tax=Gongylonema pulchrum TaxID=637853 RepID=A0A183DQ68_9BILA|nr:unnamed protein product [Gongylonema pulchrum]
MTCRKISGARANPEHAESEKVRQRADSFGTGIGKVSAFAGRRGGRFIPSQAEDLAAWDFGTLGRSGSSSMASVVDSSHSRTSSFGLAGSTEDARKAILEKEAENPLEKVWSEELSKSNVQPIDDDEYVLYEPDSSTETLASGAMTSTTIIKSTPRMIGTIMEQNASSGSSRSPSPVLSKVKKSTTENEEPEAASQVTEESFSAKEIPRQNSDMQPQATTESEHSESGILGGRRQTTQELSYTAVGWSRPDAMQKSASRYTHPDKKSIIKSEYAIIKPS